MFMQALAARRSLFPSLPCSRPIVAAGKGRRSGPVREIRSMAYEDDLRLAIRAVSLASRLCQVDFIPLSFSLYLCDIISSRLFRAPGRLIIRTPWNSSPLNERVKGLEFSHVLPGHESEQFGIILSRWEVCLLIGGRGDELGFSIPVAYAVVFQ